MSERTAVYVCKNAANCKILIGMLINSNIHTYIHTCTHYLCISIHLELFHQLPPSLSRHPNRSTVCIYFVHSYEYICVYLHTYIHAYNYTHHPFISVHFEAVHQLLLPSRGAPITLTGCRGPKWIKSLYLFCTHT